MAKAATTTPRSDELEALMLIASSEDRPDHLSARAKIRECFPTVGQFLRFRGEASRRAAKATAEDVTAFFLAMKDARSDSGDARQLGAYALSAVAQDGPRPLAARAQAFLADRWAHFAMPPDEVAALWPA